MKSENNVRLRIEASPRQPSFEFILRLTSNEDWHPQRDSNPCYQDEKRVFVEFKVPF